MVIKIHSNLKRRVDERNENLKRLKISERTSLTPTGSKYI